MLEVAHPIHLQLLSENDYINGELVGVVGDSWPLKTDPVSVTLDSANGVKEETHYGIVSFLLNDVKGIIE